MNVKSALFGLLVALTIVLASTTVYESGTKTTLTSTSTSTTTATNTVTTTGSLLTVYGFDFITASGNCDGGNAPCWGQPAYVFNCPPSFPAEPGGSCSKVVVSDVFPFPTYGINVVPYHNQSQPWANCAYELGFTGEVGAYCVLLNSTAFILGEPAPPPSTSGVQSSSAVASIQVPAASVSRLDLQTHLSLTLNLTATANQTITVTAYDVNTLDSANNLSTGEDWAVTPWTINGVCAGGWVDFVVYQGDYGLGNFTQGTPVPLSQGKTICGGNAASYYIFGPQSSEATAYGTNPTQVNASISATLFGYWVTDSASAHPQETFLLFPPGTYTVAAVDEWGDIVLSHFTVQD